MEQLLFNFGSIKLDWNHVLLSLLVSFLCASMIAVCYERTFRGLSWSRNLLQTMILASQVACLVMMAVGDNVARGIGIVGSLAVIRFRTNLRDPRDLVFLFGSVGVGIASGVQSYVTAVLGAALFCGIALALQYSRFGERRTPDGLVRFQAPAGSESSARISGVLTRLPARFALVTMRPAAQGEMVDYAYQVRLKTEGDEDEVLRLLEQVPGIQGLTYINQQATVEL